MALIFKPFKSTLPTKDGEYLYYPRLVKTGTAGTREVAKQIAWATALTPGDVQNVLHTLTEVMNQYLMNSQSVRLDGLGTFTIVSKAEGTGVKTPDEVSSTQITRLCCRFTPEYTRNPGNSGVTRALMSNVKYKSLASMTAKGTASSEGDDDDDYVDPDL